MQPQRRYLITYVKTTQLKPQVSSCSKLLNSLFVCRVNTTVKMRAGEITAFCILWKLFHLSSCSIAHMKYSKPVSKLKAINWGLPLAGHKLNATPVATSRVTNHIKCMAQCAKTEGCVAINLGPLQGKERECEMLDITRYSVSSFNFTAKAGWTYIGPKV